MDNNNEILSKIKSGNPELVAEAIKEFQENGDLNIATTILQNLELIQEPHIVTIVVNLLADIKENNFREVLMQKLQDTTSPQIMNNLLRIVWESSLDYSIYLEFFLNLLQNDDFSVAFEASTIIENMVHNLTQEQFHQLHEIIESFPQDKQYLVENIHEAMEA